MKVIQSVFFTVSTLLSVPALSHHTGSIYDMNQDIELQGIVEDFEWRNPHVYIWLKAETEEGDVSVWEIEGRSPSVLKRWGWTKNSIQIGDRLTITGNPGRDAGSNIAVMKTLVKADTTELKAESPSGHAGLLESYQENLRYKDKTTSIAGVWTIAANGAAIGKFYSPASLALTDKGKAAVESFKEMVDSSGANCIPYSAPMAMVIPDLKKIEISDDRVLIKGEYNETLRTIYLDRDFHASNASSVQGDSIGYWEGGALVVDTVGFKPDRSGNAYTLPSGSNKHLVERFELNDERTRLLYSFTLEDPEYLSEPLTLSELQWIYRTDLDYQSLPCDLENARRFIQE